MELLNKPMWQPEFLIIFISGFWTQINYYKNDHNKDGLVKCFR